jgi:acetyl esterase
MHRLTQRRRTGINNDRYTDEGCMAKHLLKRRQLLLAGAATGLAISVPMVFAAGKTSYKPGAKFDLAVSELEYRRNAKGRSLKARIYRPSGPGPFPVLLDLHGGAWNAKDRLAEEPFDRAIATAGALVVAIDMTLAPEAPYPACVQDANYAVRWLKLKAKTWNGDVSRFGVFGSSSGGHVAELLSLRPHDPRYNAVPLPEAPHLDAAVDYVALRSPISNTFARYENAEALHDAGMIKNNVTFFVPWETIHESNPQEILDRREEVTLNPLLIMQGALDTNVRPAAQTKFVESYHAAGGRCDYTIFEGCEHEWVAQPGPQTDRAHEMVKAFIARHVNA